MDHGLLQKHFSNQSYSRNNGKKNLFSSIFSEFFFFAWKKRPEKLFPEFLATLLYHADDRFACLFDCIPQILCILSSRRVEAKRVGVKVPTEAIRRQIFSFRVNFSSSRCLIVFLSQEHILSKKIFNNETESASVTACQITCRQNYLIIMQQKFEA